MYINKLFLTLIMATFATNLFAMESNNNNLNSGSGKEEEMEILEFENVLTLEDMPDEILESIIIFAIEEKDLKNTGKNFLPIAKVCKNFRQLLNGSGIKAFLVKKVFIENKDLFEVFAKLGIQSAIIFDPKTLLENKSAKQILETLINEVKKYAISDKTVTPDFLARLNINPSLIKNAEIMMNQISDYFKKTFGMPINNMSSAKDAIIAMAKQEIERKAMLQTNYVCPPGTEQEGYEGSDE